MDSNESLSLASSSAPSQFRSHKRRKVIRRRDLDELDASQPHNAGCAAEEYPDEGDPLATNSPDLNGLSSEPRSESMLDIVRRRKEAQARRGGIAFSRPGTIRPSEEPLFHTDSALVPAQAKSDVQSLAQNRFAPQTGTAVETNNEHMTAFIDAEVSRMRKQSRARTRMSEPSSSKISSAHLPAEPIQRQPASVGQIQEVDLGPAAALRNATLTEAAYRRLNPDQESQDLIAAEPQGHQPAHKPRVGRDGKPRPPPRRKQRRTSADDARDALVDAVLQEHKLGLYDDRDMDAAASHPTHEGALDGDNMTADDALAARFQAEYLEAMAERQEMNRKPPGPAPVKPGEVDLFKGPKLGGSRSARAAMHAAEKEKEKTRGKGLVPATGKR